MALRVEEVYTYTETTGDNTAAERMKAMMLSLLQAVESVAGEAEGARDPAALVGVIVTTVHDHVPVECRDAASQAMASALTQLNMGEIVSKVQQLQVAVAQSEAALATDNANVTQAQIAVAKANVAKIAEEIAKIKEEQADKPWWMTLVEIVVPVIAAVVGLVTGGIGAAILAGGMAAFMETPAFTDVVNALASALDDLTGNSALSQILAKVIVIAVMVAVTFGVTSVTAVGAEAAAAVEAGVEEGAEVAAEEGAEQATQQVAQKGIIAGMSTAGKMALMTGLSTLAGSGIWSNFMQLDEGWYKEHQELAAIISAVITVVSAIVAALVGRACVNSMASSPTMFEKFPMIFRVVSTTSLVVQGGSGIGESAYAGMQGTALMRQAEMMRELGIYQAESSQVYSNINMLKQTEKTNEDASSSIIETLGADMATLAQVSGLAWGKASSL